MAALYAWGTDNSGSLGLGVASGTTVPLPTLIPGDWKEVSSSWTHTLAIQNDGTLWAWGTNNFYELGTNGSLTQPVISPVQVGSATDWAKISASRQFSYALKTDGSLWGWGTNNSGVLTGSVSHTPTPTLIDNRVWIGLETGRESATFLLTGGALFSVGQNDGGQLGVGNTTAAIRVLTRESTLGLFSSLSRLSLDNVATAALKADGTYWYAGDPGLDGITPAAVVSNIFRQGTVGPWSKVATGDSGLAIGIQADGTLWTWTFSDGNNFVGLAGNGTNFGRRLPGQIGTATNWTNISTGSSTGAAVNAAGEVYTWGYGPFGQIGDGFQENRPSPTLVLTNISKVVMGMNQAFAIAIEPPARPLFWTSFIGTREVL